MPAISIDTPELLTTLGQTPAEQNIMLVGRHGIGKSQIVQSFFESIGQNVITFFLGQMSDPGDLIGLMYRDESTGHSDFLPPFWWPTNGEPVVLFLDELNRARPEILQSVMDLTLNRTLAGKCLPAGSRVISAVNEGEDYQLTDLDPALISRFNIYQFVPTIEDWLVWANQNELDTRVINFIQESAEYLDGDPHARSLAGDGFGTELSRSPDRRSWERVARLISGVEELTPIFVKMISGVVGTTAALAFAKSIRDAERISADDVLTKFSKTKTQLASLRSQELAQLNERLIFRIEKGGYSAAAKKKVLKNFRLYLEFLLKETGSESCAHLASMLERPRFQRASEFLLADTAVLELLVDFIQDIAVD